MVTSRHFNRNFGSESQKKTCSLIEMELPQLMEAFWRDGFVKLGQICSQEELESLNKRLDDIMLGHIQYPNLLMQLDPFATANVQGENENDIYKQTNTEVNGQTAGFKGASLAYR